MTESKQTNKIMYKIGFTLGDYSGDGHGKCKDYHVECNYSAEDISIAYQKFVEEVGFDFLEELKDYEHNTICEEHASKFIELKLIGEDDFDDFGEYTVYNGEELIDLFFSVISLQLPYFQWEYRNLEESTLYELDGAGYGLYWG